LGYIVSELNLKLNHTIHSIKFLKIARTKTIKYSENFSHVFGKYLISVNISPKKWVGHEAYSTKRARENMFLHRCKILPTLKE
jgi:hypothetical protein